MTDEKSKIPTRQGEVTETPKKKINFLLSLENDQSAKQFLISKGCPLTD